MSKISEAFLAALKVGDLPAQVRIAQIPAQFHILSRGIDNEPFDAINDLVGEPFEPGDARSRAWWGSYCDHLQAAFALGIAVGQLVHPNVFRTSATAAEPSRTKVGAR